MRGDNMGDFAYSFLFSSPLLGESRLFYISGNLLLSINLSRGCRIKTHGLRYSWVWHSFCTFSWAVKKTLKTETQDMLRKIRGFLLKIHPKESKGLTLIEVLVSMIIFATGLLMLVPMIITSIKGNEWADMTTKAAHHIHAKIEEIKNTHDWTTGNDSPEGMIRTWSIEDHGSFLKKIIVGMTWLDKDSTLHRDSVITYESFN
jgi:prepilin-type N-terminal cleavage/methylation domain-containing protein